MYIGLPGACRGPVALYMCRVLTRLRQLRRLSEGPLEVRIQLEALLSNVAFTEDTEDMADALLPHERLTSAGRTSTAGLVLLSFVCCYLFQYKQVLHLVLLQFLLQHLFFPVLPPDVLSCNDIPT
jgi:hypothetical protein